MPYLPNVIKKIDDFCNLAESLTRLKRMAAPSAWTMPDDPEEEVTDEKSPGDEWIGLYPKITSVANQLGEQADDVANELRLIAELYKKALEINGGYSQLSKAISISLANIDSLIDESDGVIGEDIRDAAEDILEEVAGDLRRRAKSSIGQQMDEASAMKALRSVKQEFNSQEARHEMESQKSVYEKGKPGAETGHGINAPAVLETPQKYVREIKRLQELLEQEKNPGTKQYMLELQKVLASLVIQMPKVSELSSALKDTPDDTAKQNEFNEATQTLEDLRSQRRLLKSRLNNQLLNKEKEDLVAQMGQTRNTKEREWLQERINLLDLRTDDKLLKKRDEIKARKALVNSMGVIDEHGDFQSQNIPEAERIALLRGIQLGRDVGTTKAKYDRTRTEERAKTEGRKDIATRAPQRGGWAPGERQTSLDKAMSNATYFPLLVGKVGPGINTAVAGATYYIARAKEGGYVELKTFIDAVSAAIRKKDMAAKHAAIAALREEAKKYVFGKNKEAVASYEIAIRLTPYFRKIEERLKQISAWQHESGQWILDEQKSNFIRETNMYITRIIEIYNKQYGHRRSNFNSFVNGVLVKSKEYIEQEILNENYNTGVRVQDQPEKNVRVSEEGEEQPEEEESVPQQRMKLLNKLISNDIQKKAHMSNIRKNILTKILSDQKLQKEAQETIAVENDIDQVSADKQAKEIYDNIFDEELQKLIGQ